MADEKQITITATVNPRVAYQLAQFCKRVGFSTAFDYTEGHLSVDERNTLAYQMLAGLDAVAAGLRDVGISPR
ncbi:MAG: DUF7706 family protein [Burkholderiaceae bacterium]